MHSLSEPFCSKKVRKERGERESKGQIMQGRNDGSTRSNQSITAIFSSLLLSLSHAYLLEKVLGEGEGCEASIVSLKELLGLLNILQGPLLGDIVLNSILSKFMSCHVIT